MVPQIGEIKVSEDKKRRSGRRGVAEKRKTQQRKEKGDKRDKNRKTE